VNQQAQSGDSRIPLVRSFTFTSLAGFIQAPIKHGYQRPPLAAGVSEHRLACNLPTSVTAKAETGETGEENIIRAFRIGSSQRIPPGTSAGTSASAAPIANTLAGCAWPFEAAAIIKAGLDTWDGHAGRYVGETIIGQ